MYVYVNIGMLLICMYVYVCIYQSDVYVCMYVYM